MSPNALERNAWEMRCNSRKWLKKQMPIARSRGCGMEARVGVEPTNRGLAHLFLE